MTCSRCGRTAPDDDPAARLGWSTGTDHARLVATCDRCTRDNVRAIEAKLEPEWW